MTGSNQYERSTLATARQEIEIMEALKSTAMTSLQLSEALGISQTRAQYLLGGLKSANCVAKIPGSHAVKLLAVCSV